MPTVDGIAQPQKFIATRRVLLSFTLVIGGLGTSHYRPIVTLHGSVLSVVKYAVAKGLAGVVETPLGKSPCL